MSKFNKVSRKNGVTSTTKGKTINKEGEEAFELRDKERLVTGVLTCFVNEPKFYGDTTGDIKNVAQKLSKTDPEFVAKLAAYSRNVFHMRSVSQMLIAEVAKISKGNSIVRKATRAVIERPDDMTNIIAYHINTYGPRTVNNPVPSALRRGIADAFHKFDEYQLAKYKGSSNEVKLKDALLISHPKPKTIEQAELWKRLIEDKLKTPKTRETVLSDKGQSKETWEELIDSKKLGYMALLRNLKNILSYGISSDRINTVLTYLRKPENVRRSKQLPFRFFSAYKMVEDLKGVRGKRKVLDALEEALRVSFENLERLPGTTAIITDESASMIWSTVSKNSMIRLIDVGNLLGAALDKFTDTGIIIPFGEIAKELQFSKYSSIMDNINRLENSGVGHSTNLIAAFEIIDKLDTPVDRIIIFSDMQCYSDIHLTSRSSPQKWINEYRKRTGVNTWVHSIDLQGYGTTQIVGNRVNLIAGWSDKVLEYISKVENGGQDLVRDIENYELY